MNSKEVSKALRGKIRPILKQAGFVEFSDRKCWRVAGDVTQVIDFAALGSYLSDAIGATPFSFSCNLGTYFHCIAGVPWGKPAIPPRPQEYECHARRFLMKSLPQQQLPRRDIWLICSDGGNLAAVIDDLEACLHEQAFPWFEAFSNAERALSAFESKGETFEHGGIAVEMLGGQLGSFSRAEIASALANSLGQQERALRAWEAMLENPYYARLDDLRAQATSAIGWLRKTN